MIVFFLLKNKKKIYINLFWIFVDVYMSGRWPKYHIYYDK